MSLMTSSIGGDLQHAPKRIKLDNPTPILADDLIKQTPLTQVYVATIKNPKNISKAVLELNSKLPMHEFLHLKRVKCFKQDNSNLKVFKVLLFEKNTQTPLEIEGILKPLTDKDSGLLLIEPDSIESVFVAKVAPKLKHQFDQVNALWPCNFHPNKYLESVVDGSIFSPQDLAANERFMKICLQACALTKSTSSAVVVDSCQKIVAIGYDQSQDNPNKHSIMVAIDNVAKTQSGGVWSKTPLDGVIEDAILDSSQTHEVSSDDYLCTGLTVYVVREPCITCAMALVHSRVKRVFYGVRSDTGGLGSLCKVHLVEALNHRYEVFAGLLESRCRELQIE